MGDPNKIENETPDTPDVEGAEGAENVGQDGSQEEQKQDEEHEDEPVEDRLKRTEDELAKVREEAASRRIANRELKQQLANAKTDEDVQAAVSEYEEKVATLERQILVRDVADEFNLPPALRDRLKGETEEELKADAKVLAELVPQQRRDFDEDEAGGGMDPSDRVDDFDEDVRKMVERARRGR